MLSRVLFFLIGFFVYLPSGFSNTHPDDIIGQWMSVQDNVKVQVYRDGNEYKAKVLWFKDTDDKSKPMNTRTDERNPDPKLRNRKIIGMQVLSKMRFNSKSGRWEDGLIYDAKTGKEWSSVAYF